MKIFILCLLATLAYAEIVKLDKKLLTAYGYIKKRAIPLAILIREYESKNINRLTVGGAEALREQFPYQAAVLTNYHNQSTDIGVCGGSLVAPNRVITAAHCWYDGVDQGYQSVIVLGSITLFYGGTRLLSKDTVVHPNYNPNESGNDVAINFLHCSVLITNTIAPISLPSGSELQDDYVGTVAVASGFGLTSHNGTIGKNQFLSFVPLTIISNTVCMEYVGDIDDTTICTNSTSSPTVTSTCLGDSGGPLAITRDNKTILIGVVSDGGLNCEMGDPAMFSRVSAFIEFLNQKEPSLQ